MEANQTMPAAWSTVGLERLRASRRAAPCHHSQLPATTRKLRLPSQSRTNAQCLKWAEPNSPAQARKPLPVQYRHAIFRGARRMNPQAREIAWSPMYARWPSHSRYTSSNLQILEPPAPTQKPIRLNGPRLREFSNLEISFRYSLSPFRHKAVLACSCNRLSATRIFHFA